MNNQDVFGLFSLFLNWILKINKNYRTIQISINITYTKHPYIQDRFVLGVAHIRFRLPLRFAADGLCRDNPLRLPELLCCKVLIYPLDLTRSDQRVLGTSSPEEVLKRKKSIKKYWCIHKFSTLDRGSEFVGNFI